MGGHARETGGRQNSALVCAVLLLLQLLIGMAPVAQGARSQAIRQQLDDAVNIYNHGGYLEAAARLTELLYPLKITDRRDIVRARVYLGMAYYVLDRKEDAADEFRGVFRLNPKYMPDPLYIPLEIIRFIEQQRPPPPEYPRTTAVPGLGEKVNPPDIKPPDFAFSNLLPLGIPQLKHRDYGRGIAFATTELGLLALNIGTYYYLRYNNTNANTSEQYPYLVAARAANLASLPILAVTVALGAGDALYRYRAAPTPVSLHLQPSPDFRGAELKLEMRF